MINVQISHRQIPTCTAEPLHVMLHVNQLWVFDNESSFQEQKLNGVLDYKRHLQ